MSRAGEVTEMNMRTTVPAAGFLLLLFLLAPVLRGESEAPAPPPSAPTGPEGLSARMDTDTLVERIDVSIRYAGKEIGFFGAAPEENCTIVAKLTSVQNPPVKLMRKGKVALFWMGVKQLEVSGMPFMFKVGCSAPMSSIPADLKRELMLDYDALRSLAKVEVLRGTPSADDRDVLFDGFIRLKEKEGLYRIRENNIRLSANGRLFSHTFHFPDRAIEGEYRVETYAIKNGRGLAHGVNTVTVGKVGLQSWLSGLATGHGLAYGIIAVVVALTVGLSIGLVFKKGGGH
jgi:hypothetical protein